MAAPTADLDTLCINTIRTLAMDAVQQANSGHPGAPMGLAPVAYTLFQRAAELRPRRADLAEPRSLRAFERPRFDAALRDAAPVRRGGKRRVKRPSLGHRDDAPAGVPVHVLSAAVLGEAGTVDEALELLRSAPIATSGALTLIDPDTVACAEVSPVGVATLRPSDGFLTHTNHFLDPANAAREKTGLYEPDSQDRYGLIASRQQRYAEPAVADHLVEYLYSDPGQPQLCCVPAPDAVFGQRWATLATVLLEPEHRRARILAGTPIDARRRSWTTLDATGAACVVGG